jgi:hypothetical protein
MGSLANDGIASVIGGAPRWPRSADTADVMLTQKIALELFEVEALKVANKVPALDLLLDSEQRGS